MITVVQNDYHANNGHMKINVNRYSVLAKYKKKYNVFIQQGQVILQDRQLRLHYQALFTEADILHLIKTFM